MADDLEVILDALKSARPYVKRWNGIAAKEALEKVDEAISRTESMISIEYYSPDIDLG